MIGTHCDGPDCRTWTTKPKKHGFLTVSWDGRVFHFCSWDCTLKYGATKEPITVIE